MAEPITWATCVAGLATACAGPIMAACSEEVFPRLKTCITDLIKILRSNGDQPNPLDLPNQPDLLDLPNQPDLPDQHPEGQTNAGPMIIARDLKIEHSEKPECWDWIDDPRFTEVAVLLKVWFFHIKTSVSFLGLSANTKYGAYLIFKITEDSEGLDAIQNTSVSVGRKQEKKFVCLKPTTATPPNVGRPKERSDGWLELELGQFYCDNVTGDKEAVIIIEETKRLDNKKAGLKVAGIQIRPI